MINKIRNRLQWECLLAFGVAPVVVYFLKPKLWVYAFLWVAAAFVWRMLSKDPGYSFERDWNAGAIKLSTVQVLLWRFLPFAIFLMAITVIMAPEDLLIFVLEKKLIWIMGLVVYPLFVVLPQSLIFRSFFFHRYRELFRSEKEMIAASAAAFTWAHLPFSHFIPLLLALVGGWLFAHTYSRQRSLALSFMEHSLYACYMLTVGAGYFFYYWLMK